MALRNIAYGFTLIYARKHGRGLREWAYLSSCIFINRCKSVREDLRANSRHFLAKKDQYTYRYQDYMNAMCSVILRTIIRRESIPVRRRVLLKHAYVTINTGPKIGWNLATRVRQRCAKSMDLSWVLLAWSKPEASRPNQRSSIHQAINLPDIVNQR